MEKTIIKPGIVLIKKDGIIYELDKKTLQTIKAIVFDTDCNLCKLCSNTKCKSSKKIEDECITDTLTLKTKPNCEYVFGCDNFELKGQYNDAPRLVWFSTDFEEEMNNDEITIRHYNEAHVRHIAHPTIARHIDKI